MKFITNTFDIIVLVLTLIISGMLAGGMIIQFGTVVPFTLMVLSMIAGFFISQVDSSLPKPDDEDEDKLA